MQHSFDIMIAERFGVNVAIFLNNIVFWIKKNQANERHYYDGRFWTYNSQAAFLKLFPYWSRKTLRTTIDAANKHGLIMQGNYNKSAYDRTTWYALSDFGLSLFPLLNAQEPSSLLIGRDRPIDFPESAFTLAESGQPIPDSKPDIKTDTISSNKKNGKQLREIIDVYHEELPDSPKIRVPSDELGRLVKVMVNRWPELNEQKEEFNLDALRNYFRFIKEHQPTFLAPYETKNHNLKKNGLTTLIRFDTIANFINEKWDFKAKKR